MQQSRFIYREKNHTLHKGEKSVALKRFFNNLKRDFFIAATIFNAGNKREKWKRISPKHNKIKLKFLIKTTKLSVQINFAASFYNSLFFSANLI